MVAGLRTRVANTVALFYIRPKATHQDSKTTQPGRYTCQPHVTERKLRHKEAKELRPRSWKIDVGAGLWVWLLGSLPLYCAAEGSLLQAACAKARVPHSGVHLGTACLGEVGGISRESICSPRQLLDRAAGARSCSGGKSTVSSLQILADSWTLRPKPQRPSPEANPRLNPSPSFCKSFPHKLGERRPSNPAGKIPCLLLTQSSDPLLVWYP